MALPSSGHQLLNMSRDIVSAIQKAALERKVLNSDESITQNRLDICEACPKHSKGRCQVCGCFVKLKTKFAAFKCPLGKW